MLVVDCCAREKVAGQSHLGVQLIFSSARESIRKSHVAYGQAVDGALGVTAGTPKRTVNRHSLIGIVFPSTPRESLPY